MTLTSTRYGFVIAICLLSLLHFIYGTSLWWMLLPIILSQLLLIYGSSIIHSNFYGPVHCCAGGLKKEIALSFDDGPNRVFTPQILSVLEQFNVPATFFVIGKHVSGNEDILQQIDAAGHSLGNHSFTHSVFVDFKGLQGFKNELTKTADIVFGVIGKRMKMFRPPFGVTTPSLMKASSQLDYRVIGWSVRSLDTTSDSAQTIVRRVQAQLQPGAIILFHDASDKTVEALTQTLKFAKENGYKVVSVEKLLNIDAYEK
ncbi:MAG: polysaccharide deacetylase family protein [Methylococcales bacterium]|nr:polysaccharide deacetylase family protein [Methylococcaceae bacterium]